MRLNVLAFGLTALASASATLPAFRAAGFGSNRFIFLFILMAFKAGQLETFVRVLIWVVFFVCLVRSLREPVDYWRVKVGATPI